VPQAASLSFEVAYDRISQILGCKWSLSIFDCLEKGVARPSAICREVAGLSSRALHRCLSRLEQDGLLERIVHSEIPPHVEYRLTEQGERFLRIVREARRLAESWMGTQPPLRFSSRG
jgi:DNA-binding HxlR family transcriptional regulator